MEYRRLGSAGLKVSELCLGTMQFGWTADDAASFRSHRRRRSRPEPDGRIYSRGQKVIGRGR
jgi:hypothetical protein